MKLLDDSWERNEHFSFFQSRRNPCFSISFLANVTNLCALKTQNGFRFTDCIYFAAMLAANGVAGFRQRIVNLRPVEFESIDAAFTYIPKGRSLHCNCVAKFDNNFSVFSDNISAARASADQRPTLCPEGGDVHPGARQQSARSSKVQPQLWMRRKLIPVAWKASPGATRWNPV